MTGVMHHVGEALGDTLTQARHNIVSIGIAPWGVVHKRGDLIGRDVSQGVGRGGGMGRGGEASGRWGGGNGKKDGRKDIPAKIFPPLNRSDDGRIDNVADRCMHTRTDSCTSRTNRGTCR